MNAGTDGDDLIGEMLVAALKRALAALVRQIKRESEK